jgi:hypothetical protein
MIEIYERYLAALKATPPAGRMMPYDWSRLPNSLSFTWMPYRLMFDEFSREIANSVNELTNHVHRLRAWSAVISTITERPATAITRFSKFAFLNSSCRSCLLAL